MSERLGVSHAVSSPPRKVAMSDKKNSSSRKQEFRSFAFLTVVMAPVLVGALIVAYGFAVWIFQMFAGPPHA